MKIFAEIWGMGIPELRNKLRFLAQGFGPGRIRALVTMAVDSSHKVLIE